MDLNLQIFINYLSISNMILNHNVNCNAIFIFSDTDTSSSCNA